MERVAVGFVGPLGDVFTAGSFETTLEVAAILEERGFIRRAPRPLRLVSRSTAYLPADGRSMADCREAARQVERTLTKRHASEIRRELGEY